ncbi:hypothetical protein KC318_g9856, partial [Hortaea werneckii]
DSLDEILSGRTPAPAAGAAGGGREELPSVTNQQSFTQIISESMDYDEEDEEGGGMTGGGLDDTFREKKKKKKDEGKGKGKGVEVRAEEVVGGGERDPLDDSEIF